MRVLLSSLLFAAAAGVAMPNLDAQQGQGGVPPGPARGAGANQAQQTGTGIIFGQVVDAASGQPVPAATVTITANPGRGGGAGPRGAGAAAPLSAAQPPRDRTLLTDSEGRFVYHDLPAGAIVLNATAFGYANGAAGQTRPNGPLRPIDLGDGERLSDVKIRLWKYGVVSGTVLDEAGEPAIGVSVRAMRKTSSSGRPVLTASGQTKSDDRGIYRLSQLLPGEYVLAIPQTQATMPAAIMESMMKGVASGAGVGTGFMDIMSSGGPMPDGRGLRLGDYVTSSTSGVAAIPPTADGRILAYQTLFYPTAGSAGDATIVSLKSGEERTGLNFQLRVIATARVSGTVTGPEGPAGNLGVRLVPANSDPLANETGFETATTATRPDGTFVFFGVPPGQYVAKVLKQPRPQIPAELAGNPLMGLAFGSGMGGAPTGMAAMTLYAQAPVTVAGADVANVALALNEGSKLSGRIVFQGNAQAPTPQTMPQVSITLISADGRNPNQTPRGGQPMTDQTGAFKTQGYPAGKYFVQVSGAVPPGWMMKSALAGGRDAMTQPLELKDSDVSEVIVTMTDQIGQVTGTARVSGTAATPPAATVILFPIDFQSWAANGMAPRLTRNSVVAPKTGSFTLPTVLAGDYLVVALDDRDVSEDSNAAYFSALSRVATKISVGDGEKKSVDLQIARIR